MPNIDNWIGTDRAVDAWARIQDKPISISIHRSGVDLDAQTVRLEEDDNVSEISGAGNAIVSVQRGTLFGVRNHATVADTDIQKGDRFKAPNGLIYRVIHVKWQTGEIQASVEAQA